MLNRLKHITQLGFSPELDHHTGRNVVRLNKMSISLMLMALIRIPFDIILQNTTGLIFAIGLFVFPIFVLIGNAKMKYSTVKWVFYIFVSIYLTLIKIFFGVGIGAEFGFVLLGVCVVIFFRDKKEKFPILVMILSFYIIAATIETIFGPVEEEIIDKSTFYFFLATSTGLCLWLFEEFIADNEKYLVQSNVLLEELKINEEKIIKQNHELEVINENLEKFAYTASHDLKNPLKNISSFVHLLKKHMIPYNDERANKYIGIISDNSSGLDTLVEEILAFAKMEVGRTAKESVDLQNIIQGVKSNLYGLLEEKNGIVDCGFLPDIYANSSLMTILFQNLIENGIKYNESPNPKIKIFQKILDENILIYVEDNGIGISEEYQKKIFDMFVRADPNSGHSGTGIGLATCKKIVEQMNGQINIESTKEGGCTFVIKWPTSIIIPKKVQVVLPAAKRSKLTNS